MKDNRGVTLVELLVALSAGAVVCAGVAALLITCLRLYGRANANVELQSESQTALNLVLDNVMEARGVGMKAGAPGSNTDIILLGNLLQQPDGMGVSKVYYSGTAVIADYTVSMDSGGNPLGELYLVDFPNDDVTASVTTPDGTEYAELGTDMRDALQSAYDYLTGLNEMERRQWLLAKNLKDFRIKAIPDPETMNEVVTDGGASVTYHYFKEPLTFNIVMKFKKDYGFGNIERTVEDNISVRNKLQRIYIGNEIYNRK